MFREQGERSTSSGALVRSRIELKFKCRQSILLAERLPIDFSEFSADKICRMAGTGCGAPAAAAPSG